MPLNPTEATAVSNAVQKLKSTVEKAYHEGRSGVTQVDYMKQMEALNKQINGINASLATDSPAAIGQKCRALTDAVTQLSWHAPGTHYPYGHKKARQELDNTTGVALKNFFEGIGKTSVIIPPSVPPRKQVTVPVPSSPSQGRSGTTPAGSSVKQTGSGSQQNLMNEMKEKLLDPKKGLRKKND